MLPEISRRTLLRGATLATVGAAVTGVGGVGRAAAQSPSRRSDDITFALRAVTVTPAAPPDSAQHTADAFAILTDGKTSYGSEPGVAYDFTTTDPAKRSVSITAQFSAVAEVTRAYLYGSNLNSDYSIETATASFTAPDGTVHAVPIRLQIDKSGQVTLAAVSPTAKLVSSFTITVATGAKVNLTELAFSGTAHGVIDLRVDDPTDYHAHGPRQDFTVSVLPQLIALGDISRLTDDLSVTPGTTPFGSQNVDQAATLLTDGQLDYGSNLAVQFDFWGTDESKRYVDIQLDYPQQTQFQSATLTTVTMNGEYSLTAAMISFLDTSGTVVATQPALLSNAGNQVVATLSLPTPVTATSLVIRASTAYKINVTELQVTGAMGTAQTLPTPRLVARWKDFRGNRLTGDQTLRIGATQTVRSPAKPAPGYYGLEFAADSGVVFADHIPGETREYGFAVLSQRTVAQRQLDPGSFFGMVHDDVNDPYLVGWSKILEWMGGNFDAAAWKASIQRQIDAGLIELPLVHSAEWNESETNSDSEPIGPSTLDGLRTRIREHLTATPSVRYWELGLEENLQDRFHNAKYYWSNLDAKVTAARAGAADASVDAKYIFQIAEPEDRKPDVTAFLSSTAAPKFDVLALHPYAWPDFPSPEQWMSDLMDFTHSQMESTGVRLPVWFTEVGAPHAINYPGGWFGYGDRNSPDPNINRQVTGLSKRAEVAYLIKIFALGLQMGADKVFWYNYVDHGSDRTFPENAFGVFDFWGFPKPAYLAFITTQQIDNRRAAGIARLPGGVWASTFAGDTDDIHVLWCYPNGRQQMPWRALGLSAAQVGRLTNSVGTSLNIESSGVQIGIDPVFVSARHTTDLARHASVIDSTGSSTAGRVVTEDETIWTADGTGRWLQIDLGHACDVGSIRIDWAATATYRYAVSTSTDGQQFSIAVDQRTNSYPRSCSIDGLGTRARYVRIDIAGADRGPAPAIRRVSVFER